MTIEIIELTKDQIIKPEGPDAPALRKSINAERMFERPVVRPTKDGKYEVVMGRKRVLETLFHGGYNTVECEVRHEYDDELVAVANLTSNHSHTLNMRVDPWHVKMLLEGCPEQGIEPRTQTDLAAQTGMSQGKISQLYSVFSLCEGLQAKVKAGLMGIGAVRLAGRLSDEEQAALALQEGKITATDVNKLLDARKQAAIESVQGSEFNVRSLESDNPEPGTRNTELFRGGLVINGEKLDRLLTGAEVEVEIGGQKLLIQVVGEST